jgi:CheY-like chemotaxis protein
MTSAMPMMQSSLERLARVFGEWSLDLVVDAGASMVIWRQPIAEFRELLRTHVVGSEVRTWHLLTDAREGQPLLQREPGMDAGSGTGIRPCELDDPAKRSLVLVVSDCVSRKWHTGEAAQVLARWGRERPVCLVQVLPDQLWGRTALRNGPSVLLRASHPGATNSQLLALQEPWLASQARPMEGLFVPVVQLEPGSLAEWARLVGGDEVLVRGVELLPARTLPRVFTGTAPTPSAEARVQRFLATASAPARKLAGLLSAAPLRLPVMHLIRKAMVPEAEPGQLAEVFLGGLLRELPGQEAVRNPEERDYDFWPGVRELLLDTVPAGSARTVLLHVSDSAGADRDSFLMVNAKVVERWGASDLSTPASRAAPVEAPGAINSEQSQFLVAEDDPGTRTSLARPHHARDVEPVHPRQAGTHAHGRILIVHDDVLVSSAVRRTLAREHDVEVVTNPRHALELLMGKGTEVDVILCGLMMQELTGMELHARLSVLLPEVARRMVFIVGMDLTPAARAFMDTVRSLRVDTPFDPVKLREQVREWVVIMRGVGRGHVA